MRGAGAHTTSSQSLRLAAALALLATLIAVALAGSSSAAPGSGFQRAILAQEANSSSLLARGAVVGTAVGVDGAGEAEILVLATRPIRVASELGGVPVDLEVTGPISTVKVTPAKKPESPGNGGGGGGEVSLSPTDVFPRPVPIGVSTGNAGQCSAGTIGARVKDGSGNVYALSNNHVYALENKAAIGSEVLQPGRYDTECAYSAKNHLGNLSAFEPIVFSASAENTIDAAIASVSSADLGNATPSNGYGTPSSTTLPATAALLGRSVQKYGRTTGLTSGNVVAVNGIVNVGYSAGTARFEHQIFAEARKPMLRAGDSGSLLVTRNSAANPVGLVFAGDSSGKFAIANPIDPVLARFGVTIDGK